MRYLSGADTQMLYADTAHAQNIIAPITICDPTTAPGGAVDYAMVLEYVRARLHASDSFRERLVRSPLGLDRPLWINDPNFDLEYHVREIALPSPGDWRQLCAQVSRLGARPLDMSRPPWELYIIQGLDAIDGVPQGSFATMLKLHHAAVDGVAGAELVSALMEAEPDAEPEPPDSTWMPEKPPSARRMFVSAAWHTAARPVASYREFLRAAATAPRAILRTVRPPAGNGGLGPLSATRFNRAISPHRVWDAVRIDLAEIKRIKNAVAGATVNDVAVTIVGGGLRRYLAAKGELPAGSLTTIMPISVRPTMTQKPTDAQVTSGAAGNRFAMAMIGLGTDIEDPLQRLTFIHDGTIAAKEYGVDALTLVAATEALPGALLGTAQRAVMRVVNATGRSMGAHTIVTNVPGPRTPLYLFGARVLFMSGMAPVVDGMGLINGIGSYCDEFFICWTADRDQMPDPEFYGECLLAEAEALGKAVSPAPVKKARRRRE